MSWELKSRWRERSRPSALLLKRGFVFSSKKMVCGHVAVPTQCWERGEFYPDAYAQMRG